MKYLFFIYLGGSCEGALVELHDIRLVVAQTIEETYDSLRDSWWGEPQSLHLDAWGTLHWADGYRIEVVDSAPTNQSKKLYFVNLGGYDHQQFTELHKNVFVVADNAQDAQWRALKQVEGWDLPHRDYQFDVDKILDVSGLLTHWIKLTPCAQEKPFEFVSQYVPIGKPSGSKTS